MKLWINSICILTIIIKKLKCWTNQTFYHVESMYIVYLNFKLYAEGILNKFMIKSKTYIDFIR